MFFFKSLHKLKLVFISSLFLILLFRLTCSVDRPSSIFVTLFGQCTERTTLTFHFGSSKQFIQCILLKKYLCIDRKVTRKKKFQSAIFSLKVRALTGKTVDFDTRNQRRRHVTKRHVTKTEQDDDKEVAVTTKILLYVLVPVVLCPLTKNVSIRSR